MYLNVIYPGEMHKHTCMIDLKKYVDGFPQIWTSTFQSLFDSLLL